MATRVIRSTDILAPTTGDAAPVVLASDNACVLSYFVCKTADADMGDEQRVIVTLSGVLALSHGYPNDEALLGHPMHVHGLEPYSAAEVLSSPWITEFERQNRVHPCSRPGEFGGFRHFIWTFHDTTFACLARRVAACRYAGDEESLVAELARALARAEAC